MKIQHKNLAEGKWQELSFMEQMGNIGSEISRAINWRDRDQKFFEAAIVRTFELIDLTIEDSRWRGRLKEIGRARELLGDAFLGGKEYNSDLEYLNRYFFQFALASRLRK